MMGSGVAQMREEEPAICRQLDEMIADDVLRIEPLIDEWIAEAFREGKRIGGMKLETA